MHENLRPNEAELERQAVADILEASEQMLASNPNTVCTTYAEAKNDSTQSAERRAILRGIELIHQTFKDYAGDIDANNSYCNSLTIYNEDTGEPSVYTVTRTVSNRGASATMFTLHIANPEAYRVMGVFRNGAGMIETRDSVEPKTNEFDIWAYHIVDDSLASQLAGILHGKPHEDDELNEILMKIRMSVMDSDVDADGFMSLLLEHHEKMKSIHEFKRSLGSEFTSMTMDRMRLLNRHLRGDDVKIPVIE